MLTLAEGFLERGIEVDIVLTTTDGELVNEVPNGAQLIDLEASRILASLPGLVRYLRDRQPAVLLSAMRTTNCVALWARMLSRAPTRVVISEHNAPSLLTHDLSFQDKVLLYSMSLTYPFSDCTISVSEGVEEQLYEAVGEPPEKVDVVYNPVVDKHFEERSTQHVRHPWFKNKNIPVIVGVGSLTEQKGFSTLIRAFSEVRNNRLAYLAILGEGNERYKLEKQAERLDLRDYIWMPGFVSNPLKYMAKASVFALSSRWEGLGNVLVEAMACGTPVVATDCRSGPAEILNDGEYGRLVPVGDPQALAEGIMEALEGNVQAAPCSALDRFRRETVVDQYLEILSRVA